MTQFNQGAEASIILNKELNYLEKVRNPKKYRCEELDDFLRKKRTKLEVKLLKANKRLSPQVFEVKKYSFTMQLIEGKTLKQHLNETDIFPKDLGKYIYEMHKKQIIHGDLTTSNILITPNNEIKFIDFGLGQFSNKNEHRAVDLHTLKQVLDSEYPNKTKKYWDSIVNSYKQEDTDEIFKRLQAIELRGRYKKK